MMDNVEFNMESKVLIEEQTYFTTRVWSKSVLASYKARFTTYCRVTVSRMRSTSSIAFSATRCHQE